MRSRLRPLVSIHAPTRGATRVEAPQVLLADVFQSTRPRGARPGLGVGDLLIVAVSIHAPTRGATAY